jgi:hypothetical protein
MVILLILHQFNYINYNCNSIIDYFFQLDFYWYGILRFSCQWYKFSKIV